MPPWKSNTRPRETRNRISFLGKRGLKILDRREIAEMEMIFDVNPTPI